MVNLKTIECEFICGRKLILEKTIQSESSNIIKLDLLLAESYPIWCFETIKSLSNVNFVFSISIIKNYKPLKVHNWFWSKYNLIPSSITINEIVEYLVSKNVVNKIKWGEGISTHHLLNFELFQSQIMQSKGNS